MISYYYCSIIIDHKRIEIKIGMIYAPQETRTKVKDIERMYKKIEKHVVEAEEEGQKLVIVGDLNCKIGKEIKGKREEVSPGGRKLLNLIKENSLMIVNAHEKCKRPMDEI